MFIALRSKWTAALQKVAIELVQRLRGSLPSTLNSKSGSKKTESMNIEELCAALVEIQRERDEAIQAKEAVQSKQSSSPTSSQPECFFLEKIPREVRDHIYKLLLVNEVLANHSIRASLRSIRD
jgi:hypothetical protein